MDAEHSRSINKSSILDAVLPSRLYMNGIIFTSQDILSCQELFTAFSLWSEWSDCSLTCDFGQKTRTRICQQNCDGVSSDDLSETKSCNEFICSGEQKPTCNRCQNKNFCWFLIIRVHRTNSTF